MEWYAVWGVRNSVRVKYVVHDIVSEFWGISTKMKGFGGFLPENSASSRLRCVRPKGGYSVLMYGYVCVNTYI